MSSRASEWVRESKFCWYHRVAIRVLQAGPIPRHVAFIMDGNRRFARNKNISQAEGYSMGFDRLLEMLAWCQEIGVRELTAYAFSIENFKRSREEVDTLMDLIRSKFNCVPAEVDIIRQRGICIRVIGNIAFLPKDLQRSMAKAMLLTQHNTNMVLNFVCAYTSRYEITRSIRLVAEGITYGQLMQSDIDEQLLSRCMYMRHSSEPDLLVRTSGEVRLSDFMLWQSTSAVFYFTKAMWPELNTVWHLLWAVFYYQRRHWVASSIRTELKRQQKDKPRDDQGEERVQKFIQEIDRIDHEGLLKTAGAMN